MAWLDVHLRHAYASGFRLDVQLAIGDGVNALVGPSGSGKTSILSFIAGVMRADAGRLAVGDAVLVDTAKQIWIPPERRGIGVVFQDRLLFPHLTVRQNLEFGQQRKPTRDVDFAHLVEVLELGDLLTRFPHTLSGGERQRVALGRAIARGPKLLLLDEPLTALDAELKTRVLEYIRRAIAEYRLPTVLVSHDAADVAALAEKIVRICAGRCVELAT
jgi:molybdate transport system ATP-binding protein